MAASAASPKDFSLASPISTTCSLDDTIRAEIESVQSLLNVVLGTEPAHPLSALSSPQNRTLTYSSNTVLQSFASAAELSALSAVRPAPPEESGWECSELPREADFSSRDLGPDCEGQLEALRQRLAREELTSQELRSECCDAAETRQQLEQLKRELEVEQRSRAAMHEFLEQELERDRAEVAEERSRLRQHAQAALAELQAERGKVASEQQQLTARCEALARAKTEFGVVGQALAERQQEQQREHEELAALEERLTTRSTEQDQSAVMERQKASEQEAALRAQCELLGNEVDKATAVSRKAEELFADRCSELRSKLHAEEAQERWQTAELVACRAELAIERREHQEELEQMHAQMLHLAKRIEIVQEAVAPEDRPASPALSAGSRATLPPQTAQARPPAALETERAAAEPRSEPDGEDDLPTPQRSSIPLELDELDELSRTVNLEDMPIGNRSPCARQMLSDAPINTSESILSEVTISLKASPAGRAEPQATSLKPSPAGRAEPRATRPVEAPQIRPLAAAKMPVEAPPVPKVASPYSLGSWAARMAKDEASLSMSSSTELALSGSAHKGIATVDLGRPKKPTLPAPRKHVGMASHRGP